MSEQNEVVGTQIITIDPAQYVAAVYAPFLERLETAKANAKGIVIDVSTKAGMSVAVKQRAIFRDIRVEAEKARVLRKAPILTISKLIDGRYRELETDILSYEDRFHDAIKAEEKRIEDERTAAVRAEQARIEAEQLAIKQAEEARMAAERAELARQQAELAAAQKAAAEKIEAESRAARLRLQAEEDAARAVRIAEEKRLIAEQQEAQRKLNEEAARVRAEQDAEAKRLRDEQARIAAEQRAIDDAKRAEAARVEALAKAERDKKEAIEREENRVKAEKADAYGMLELFNERYGSIEEFQPISKAIQKFLGARK